MYRWPAIDVLYRWPAIFVLNTRGVKSCLFLAAWKGESRRREGKGEIEYRKREVYESGMVRNKVTGLGG